MAATVCLCKFLFLALSLQTVRTTATQRWDVWTTAEQDRSVVQDIIKSLCERLTTCYCAKNRS